MKDVVLWAEAPGLGDHLIYSTIPELFSKVGRRVYVSKTIETRNDEVRSLLYNENPFVSGWSSGEANAGTVRLPRTFEGLRLRMNIIELVELCHELPITNRYPRIYYKPRAVSELARSIIIDPRTFSWAVPERLFEMFVSRLKFEPKETYVAESPNSGPHGAAFLAGYPRIRFRDIHEYIDAISSCAAYATTEAGGSALASAIKQDRGSPEIFALTTTQNWNRCEFIFPNVRYTVVSDPSVADDLGWRP